MNELAIITGGTSGIGLAIARRLANTHRLALVYARNHERAAQAAEIGHTVAIDVTDEAAVESGYNRIREHFQAEPSVLINCAGVSRPNLFFVQGRDLEAYREAMEVNFFGTLRMVQKVLPQMYKRKAGVIINVSSVVAQGGYPGWIGYSESKAAVETFTRNLAVEVGHRGVAVNCVSPGVVETRPGKVNQPLGRALTCDEVAAAIEFLVRAGITMNGHVLVMDGGASLQRR